MNDQRSGQIRETLQSISERSSGGGEGETASQAAADRSEATSPRWRRFARLSAILISAATGLLICGLFSGGLSRGPYSMSLSYEPHIRSLGLQVEHNRDFEPCGPGSIRHQLSISTEKGSLLLLLEKDPASVLLRKISSSIPELLQLFETGDLLERYCAARVLERMGSEAAPALPRLEYLAHSAPDETVMKLIRSVAISAPAQSTPHLGRLIGSTNRIASDGAEVILAALGPGAGAATSAVLEAFRGADPDRQTRLAETLWAITETCGETLPTLIRNLKETADSSRIAHLLRVIGQFQTSAEPAVPAIVQVLQESEDELVCYRAARALGQIGRIPEVSIPALVAKLKSSAPGETPLELVSALSGFGTNGTPFLVELARSADSAVSERAIETLLRMGKDAVAARNFFTNELHSAEEQRIIHGCAFFVEPGIASAMDMHALQGLADSQRSSAVRHMASIALVSNGRIDRQTLSILVDTSLRGFVGQNEEALNVLNRVAREHPEHQVMLLNAIHRVKSACSLGGDF